MLDIKDIVFMLPHSIFNRYPIGGFDLGQDSNTGFDRMAEAIIRNDSFQTIPARVLGQPVTFRL